jgi:ComF family protein
MRQLLNRNRVYNRSLFKQKIIVSCLLCRADTSAEHSLCDLCINALPVAEKNCHHCGIPVSISAPDFCAQCLKKLPDFDQCHSAYNYGFPINHLIQKIKHGRQLCFLSPLSKQLAQVLLHKYDDTPWPEAIIPVPLHYKRLRVRGYNQAHLLAKQIIKNLAPINRLKLDSKLVKRQKNTDSQQGLTSAERRRNTKGAFQLAGPSPYSHIAIVDDVVTTGETVSEITRLLKKQGVERVDIWCLARTPDTTMKV